jgi:hypothetical protein
LRRNSHIQLTSCEQATSIAVQSQIHFIKMGRDRQSEQLWSDSLDLLIFWGFNFKHPFKYQPENISQKISARKYQPENISQKIVSISDIYLRYLFLTSAISLDICYLS